MKNSNFTTAILFTCLFSFVGTQSLKAQRAETFAARTAQDPANRAMHPSAEVQNADTQPTYKFDITSGQQKARFEGLQDYVATILTYPEAARHHAVEGKVKVLAVISSEGKVLEATVVEPLGYGCDEVALDIVLTMPDWTPAMNFGIPVKTKTLLEFNFGLR